MSAWLTRTQACARANAPARLAELESLIVIATVQAEDHTLQGRLFIIQKLQAARRTEIARGKAKSWLYDINRHLALCAALRAEYEALAGFLTDTRIDGSHSDCL